MSEKVVSFRTGRPLAEEEATKAANERQIEEATDAALAEHRATTLEALDAIRELIAAGKLDGFVLVGRGGEGAFLTEVALPPIMPGEQILSYIGALECVRLELTDMGQDLPQMLNTGEIVAPEYVEM